MLKFSSRTCMRACVDEMRRGMSHIFTFTVSGWRLPDASAEWEVPDATRLPSRDATRETLTPRPRARPADLERTYRSAEAPNLWLCTSGHECVCVAKREKMQQPTLQTGRTRNTRQDEDRRVLRICNNASTPYSCHGDRPMLNLREPWFVGAFERM